MMPWCVEEERLSVCRWLDLSGRGDPTMFLSSCASDAVNGHILYVDGGILTYIGKQPMDK